MGMWSIVLYQDILKIIPKTKLCSHSHGNMKQSIKLTFGVTEITLEATSMATHQLKNFTASIMTWWLSGLSFNVDTVLSAHHHQVCNKTNTKLSTLGSVSSQPSSNYILAWTKQQPRVWVQPIPKSNLWESARIPFMQNLLTLALTRARIRTLW